MKRKLRGATIVAIGASIALLATGCAAGSGASSDSKVSLTFWQNSTTGPGEAFWKSTIADFEKTHKNVTIKMQSIQNEDLDGKLQTALNSGSAPDIFLQRGGGKMAAMVKAGQVLDLSSLVTSKTKSAVGSGAFAAEQIDGKTLRDAGRCASRRHLLQQGPVRGRRNHRHADDFRRAERRHRQAQGERRRAGGRRREGCMARRVTGTTTSRCASAARAF